jgi:hypothetical protein
VLTARHYPQKLRATSLKSGGRSVGIVSLRTKVTEIVCSWCVEHLYRAIWQQELVYWLWWCFLYWQEGSRSRNRCRTRAWCGDSCLPPPDPLAVRTARTTRGKASSSEATALDPNWFKQLRENYLKHILSERFSDSDFSPQWIVLCQKWQC